LKDEPDNRVLECAVEGLCEYIVTGDKALLALNMYQNVRIVTVETFLRGVST
jgi:predicted nucleic acid-binding protein